MKGDSAHPTEIRLRAAVPAFRQPYGDWEFEVIDPSGYVLVFGGDETVPEDGAEEG